MTYAHALHVICYLCRAFCLYVVCRDTVLALGGSKAPEKVFELFRGREPSTEPLLRHNGLLAGAAA